MTGQLYNCIYFVTTLSKTLKQKQLIYKDIEYEENEYDGNNGNPWKIRTIDDCIIDISYRKTFFPFISEDLWDMEYPIPYLNL